MNIDTVKECLLGKTINPCTWAQHGAIAVAIVTTAAIIIPGAQLVVAPAVAAGFIYRETRGPDQWRPWYRRLVASTDRIGDWATPTVTATLAAVAITLLGL